MKFLEITDDSGFIGIANLHKYKSYISEDWDYQSMSKRIIQQINSHNIVFWSTGLENIWRVLIDDKQSGDKSFREEKSIIEVTNNKIHLINFETLTMAAAFKEIKLPEKHLQNLDYHTENGKYSVKIRQMYNPEIISQDPIKVHFEIILNRKSNMSNTWKNNVNKIYWTN